MRSRYLLVRSASPSNSWALVSIVVIKAENVNIRRQNLFARWLKKLVLSVLQQHVKQTSVETGVFTPSNGLLTLPFSFWTFSAQMLSVYLHLRWAFSSTCLDHVADPLLS